ncbi:MAG TPA: signal peptidase II [Candidatus Magasanikbacteria bacterium]|nr:signal peptidase II [Candidatus Magasanikbacteria bacterium]
MFKGDRRSLLFLFGGFFILLDLLFKQLALFVFPSPVFIFGKVGWAPTLNPGIAFSIPLSNILIIILTLITLCFFSYLIAIEKNKNSRFGLIVATFGAISNLIDRIFYQNTIDYLQVYISVFNLADVLIVVGIGIYLLTLKQCHSER